MKIRCRWLAKAALAAMMRSVPATFLSHQGAVMPLKAWRPTWFDGVALVIGSMTPDFVYAIDDYWPIDAHRMPGPLVFALPVALVLCVVLRTRASTVAIAQLPDLGPLRFRSWAVIGRGRPRRLVTLWSALIGVISHVAWDNFTHPYRRGSSAFDLNRTWLTFGDNSLSGATTLQAASHVLGALVTLLVMARMASTGYLEQRYGVDAVAEVRAGRLRGTRRLVFWAVVGLGSLGGLLWGLDPAVHHHSVIIRFALSIAAGLLVGGTLAGIGQPVVPRLPATRDHQLPAAATH